MSCQGMSSFFRLDCFILYFCTGSPITLSELYSIKFWLRLKFFAIMKVAIDMLLWIILTPPILLWLKACCIRLPFWGICKFQQMLFDMIVLLSCTDHSTACNVWAEKLSSAYPTHVHFIVPYNCMICPHMIMENRLPFLMAIIINFIRCPLSLTCDKSDY